MEGIKHNLYKKLYYLFLFSIAFAFVESSVVVYLRAIYYPEGFHFPLKRHYDVMLTVEIIREFSTLVIMVSISILLSKKFWQGFGYFLIIFGLWDIFFYVWLKVIINWPESFFTPDVLFLIPIPWIAPVLAPVIISLIMIIIGTDIVMLYNMGLDVNPKIFHWVMVLSGSIIIFYSFMSDIDASFHEKIPQQYNWLFFITGALLFMIAFIHLHYKSKNISK